MKITDQQAIPNFLRKRAELTPNRIALQYQGLKWTFQQLQRESEQMGRRLYEKGIRSDQTIGLLLSNKPETVIIIHALFSIGARILFLNTRLTQDELQWQLDDSGANWLLTEKGLNLQNDFYNVDEILIDALGDLKGIDYRAKEEFGLQQIATTMYTSGTTGNPKAVLHTFGNHWWSAIGSVLNLGLTEKDVWLCVLPLYHVSGLSTVFKSVIYGMKMVLHASFDAKAVNMSLKEDEVTIVSVVTATLAKLLDDLGESTYPATLRCILLGGGPAPLVLLERCKKKRIPVFQTYGLTETSSQIVTLSPEDSLRKLGSAGKALFPSQIKIITDDPKSTVNSEGEIAVCGPMVTHGYLHGKNKEAFQDGWFLTGDIGYLDQDGYLYVLDRRSDLIISGGENIYPAEVESVISTHRAVFEVGVTGVPDSVWGQVPFACVVLKKGYSLEPDELINYCTSRLATYKVPKHIRFVDQLPRNSTNKLLRREMKQLF